MFEMKAIIMAAFAYDEGERQAIRQVGFGTILNSYPNLGILHAVSFSGEIFFILLSSPSFLCAEPFM
jgi:hypothetical protein